MSDVLNQIEITEAVFDLPATERAISPDELEAAGLPRDFFTLSPQKKKKAVLAAYAEPALDGVPEEPTPDWREDIPETSGELPQNQGVSSTFDGYSVLSDAPRPDAELDAYVAENAPEPAADALGEPDAEPELGNDFPESPELSEGDTSPEE